MKFVANLLLASNKSNKFTVFQKVGIFTSLRNVLNTQPALVALKMRQKEERTRSHECKMNMKSAITSTDKSQSIKLMFHPYQADSQILKN